MVTTVDAGSGTLAVALEGPSKVAIICTEVDEGYEFSYTPMAPGDYLINIKFCNVTIAGCPTKAVITGKCVCQATALRTCALHHVVCSSTCAGKGRPSDIIEHSGLVVEAVEKKAGETSKAKSFKGDASKVIAKGNGLKKAFAGSAGNFTIDIKDAGKYQTNQGAILYHNVLRYIMTDLNFGALHRSRSSVHGDGGRKW